jgi:hypothetical protein
MEMEMEKEKEMKVKRESGNESPMIYLEDKIYLSTLNCQTVPNQPKS